MIAADPPAAPPAPTRVAATDTLVTLALSLPLDDGGQALTNLELWRDAGNQDGSTTSVQVTTYTTTSFSLQHVLTTSLDGIVAGKVYSFRTKAINAKGSSELSEPVEVAVAAPPAQPSTPTVDRA